MAELEPQQNPNPTPSEETEPGFLSRAISGVMGFVRSSIAKVANLGKSLASKVMPTMHDSSDIQGVPPETPSSDGGDGGGTAATAGSESSAENSPDSFVRQYKQWKLKADKDGYSIVNIGDDGRKRFYEVAMNEAYGNPVVTVEPDRAFALPTGVTYVDAKGLPATPGEKIGGIMCEDGPRFSLSSSDAPAYTVDANGTIAIGSDKWHLATLFSKDRNRFKNYDAYYAKAKPGKVRVLELADLPLYKEAA